MKPDKTARNRNTKFIIMLREARYRQIVKHILHFIYQEYKPLDKTREKYIDVKLVVRYLSRLLF